MGSLPYLLIWSQF